MAELQSRLGRHVARLRNCRRCPRMHPPPISGGPIVSEIILVGQAPGVPIRLRFQLYDAEVFGIEFE